MTRRPIPPRLSVHDPLLKAYGGKRYWREAGLTKRKLLRRYEDLLRHAEVLAACLEGCDAEGAAPCKTDRMALAAFNRDYHPTESP